MSTATTTDALEALLLRFGVIETIEMLEYAQPFLAQWEQQLREAMLSDDREKAANCAHKAISSVHLCGSPALEALLRRVKDGDNSMYSEDMQQILFAEFVAVRQSVDDWIVEHQ